MLGKALSIVTIAYEENQDLINTYESISSLFDYELSWILVINRPLKSFRCNKSTKIIQGQDSGLYDALNLGIRAVETEYFMLLHSGDMISDIDALRRAIRYISGGYDCILGGALIGNRRHESRHWKPWMLRFYVQPPHLPIIYSSNRCKGFEYDTSIKTVADFYLLKDMFLVKRLKYFQSNETYIKMGTGGLTTSGLKSLFHVTLAFKDVEGIKPIVLFPFRVLLKLILK